MTAPWINLSIGDLVNQRREAVGITQQELAKRMRWRGWNWSTPIATSVETGRRALKFNEVVDLAHLLSCSVEDFVPRSMAREPLPPTHPDYPYWLEKEPDEVKKPTDGLMPSWMSS